MHSVAQAQIAALLRALGLQPGDNLLVHAAIQFLGKPEGGVGTYFAAICEVAGGESQVSEAPRTLHPAPFIFTLAVPAFNFAFARGEPYDPANTPSQGMGAFAEYVRQLPGARRTPHPMQSLAIVGLHAEDLASRDTLSAFDPGSAFERLLALDFKLLYLGANIDATSLLHYSEQRYQVPYRYWKTFSGPVRTTYGWETRTYRMYVRDLEANPVLSLAPAQALLEQRGQWRSLPLNYGQVSLCRAVDFTAAVDDLLSADPWCLVTNRAQVVAHYRSRQAKSDKT